jgi:hypothetical protein
LNFSNGSFEGFFSVSSHDGTEEFAALAQMVDAPSLSL